MEREVMWSPWATPGLEHLLVRSQSDFIVADGLILGVHEQRPFRAHYDIRCEDSWKLREVHVRLLESSSQFLHLLTNGGGSWTSESGATLPFLDGCCDVDISVTPFTNTLPIRRLALESGASATLRMAYISVPELRVEVTEQRYTCLRAGASGSHYRFESLEQGVPMFTVELPIDQDGLVLDYPQLFRRVGAW